RDGDAQRPVPRGQTLLMTAMDRARALGVPCTLHRRPGPGPERAVIVCSFEPRPEQPQPPNVYRCVAQTQEPRSRPCGGLPRAGPGPASATGRKTGTHVPRGRGCLARTLRWVRRPSSPLTTLEPDGQAAACKAAEVGSTPTGVSAQLTVGSTSPC